MKKDLYEGNAYTGDLECLRPFLKIRNVEDNWVVGSAVGHDCSEVQIKIYGEGSEFGIEDGRISKLHVFVAKDAEGLKTSKRRTEVNYDRGWDVKPKSKFFQLWVNQLVKATS